MKNPRAQFTYEQWKAFAAQEGTENARLFLDAASKGDVGWDQNPVGDSSELEKALQYLKFDPKAIADIAKMAGFVAKAATVVGWVMIGVETVSKVLEFLGVFDEKEDQVKKDLEHIKTLVEQIYGYLKDKEEREQYKEAMTWRSDVAIIRNALSNLADSRSQSNLDIAIQNCQNLFKAIDQMLSPGWGDIPFTRTAYKYQPSAIHWLDAAYSFYFASATGVPVPDYGNPAYELKTKIFDPGYYYDVLIHAISVRVAAVAAIEPAFRSTGYDRENLRAIYAALGTFIDKWNQSFLQSTVSGPIDPIFGKLSNPIVWQPKGIPMGAVDPLSGIVSFMPEFNQGFALHWNQWNGPNGENWGGYWTVDNPADAILSGYAYRSKIRTAIFNRCGIRDLYKLRNDIFQLMSHTTNVAIGDATFAALSYRNAAAAESLSLGVIGYFAGKPGKKYAAKRVYVEATKTFRIPMMRRMDASQIQLGYRMKISAGGADAEINVLLCDYSVRSTPNPDDQPLPIFPKTPISATLRSDKATVYTVAQNALFSARDEDSWEKNGEVTIERPKSKKEVWLGVHPGYTLLVGKRRLFLDSRQGQASIKVEVKFDLDMKNPEQSFVGYATVSVTNLEPEKNMDGVILHVTVYETVKSSVKNAPEEMLADQMTLHIVPSFLLVDDEYFLDRDAGYAAMEQAVDEISDKYAISVQPGPKDPMWQVRQRAEEVAAKVASYERFAEAEPRAARRLQARIAAPEVQEASVGRTGQRRSTRG